MMETVPMTQMTLGTDTTGVLYLPQTAPTAKACDHVAQLQEILQVLKELKIEATVNVPVPDLNALTQAIKDLKIEAVVNVPAQPPAPIVVKAPEIRLPSVQIKEAVSPKQLWALIAGVYLLIAILSWAYGLVDALFYWGG